MPPIYRLMAAAMIAIAAASCASGSGENSSTTSSLAVGSPASALQEAGEDLRAAMADVAAVIAAGGGPDAQLAWSDLGSDMVSAIGDLERDPASVDVDGLRGRLESFESQYDLGAEPAWQTFIDGFDNFVENLGTLG